MHASKVGAERIKVKLHTVLLGVVHLFRLGSCGSAACVATVGNFNSRDASDAPTITLPQLPSHNRSHNRSSQSREHAARSATQLKPTLLAPESGYGIFTALLLISRIAITQIAAEGINL
ncbi:MAG: hypothetical protein COS34_11540 [Lysobacterales bacterium CG02_land_8_20_14_3_00_62_12]|nr:MAG: hypothetical protein COS34_11540 [Xanthomonadales bacterium CG02_land_8_20_14_3_00_62_12]